MCNQKNIEWMNEYSRKANSWRKASSHSILLIAITLHSALKSQSLGFELSSSLPFSFPFHFPVIFHFLATMITASKIKSVDFYRLVRISFSSLFPFSLLHSCISCLDHLVPSFYLIIISDFTDSHANLQLQCRRFR